MQFPTLLCWPEGGGLGEEVWGRKTERAHLDLLSFISASGCNGNLMEQAWKHLPWDADGAEVHHSIRPATEPSDVQWGHTQGVNEIEVAMCSLRSIQSRGSWVISPDPESKLKMTRELHTLKIGHEDIPSITVPWLSLSARLLDTQAC